jgi:hypothetical protein
VAVTLLASSIVTRQVLAVPEQAPDQRAKAEPFAGLALRVTLVPAAIWELQVRPQSIPVPAGREVTMPWPEPAFWIESVRVPAREKTAVTVFALLSVVVQAPDPVQPPPDQWSKTEPGAGLALRETDAPSTSSAEQAEPQLICPGEPVTVPWPSPERCTVIA